MSKKLPAVPDAAPPPVWTRLYTGHLTAMGQGDLSTIITKYRARIFYFCKYIPRLNGSLRLGIESTKGEKNILYFYNAAHIGQS